MIDLKGKDVVALVYDRKTGKFLGIADKKNGFTRYEEMEPANTKENMEHLSRFKYVQHEHIEFYHDPKKSICSTHVLCRTVKYQC
jgi:hypothetical protein